MKIIFFAMLWFFVEGTSAAALNSDQNKVESGSPGRRFYLNESQLQKNIASAKSGNLPAISRLANHYQWAMSDQMQAMHWLRKGARLNDPWAMVNLASLLQIGGDEADCKEAEVLLASASRSTASPELKAIALDHLETLREGFEGQGACFKWLRKK